MPAVSALGGRPLASLPRRSRAGGCSAAFLPAALVVPRGSTAAGVRGCVTWPSPAAPCSHSATNPTCSTQWPPASCLERTPALRSLRRGTERFSLAKHASSDAVREQERQSAQHQETIPQPLLQTDDVFTARLQGYGSIANAFDLDTLKGHEGQGLWQSVKQTARFYWRGLVRVYENDRAAAALRRKGPKQWSRAEFGLVYQAAKDKRRVYPFAVLALLAPEAIPFLLAFAPNMIPSTCVKPEFEAGRRLKLYAARTKTASGMHELARDLRVVNPKDFSDVKKTLGHASTFEKDFDIRYLDEARLRNYCKFLGIASWGPEALLRKRLEDYMDFIRKEDIYIAAEGVDQLSVTELESACENRGISTAKSNPARLRLELSRWIRLSTARAGSVLPNGDMTNVPVTDVSLSKDVAAVQSPMLVFIQMFMHDTTE